MVRHVVHSLVPGAVCALAIAAQQYSATGKVHVPQLDSVSAVAWVDVDRDGDLDLAATDITRGVGLFLNAGHGRFDAARWMPVPLAMGLAAADVDGDGDADLVVLSNISNSRVLFGDGAGGFSLGAVFPSARIAAFADVEGDGDLDVFLAGSQLNLMLNDGQRRFTNATATRIVGSTGASGLALTDADGDHDVDLFVVGDLGSAGGNVRLMANDGTGVFAAGVLQPPITTLVDFVAAADFDGDRDPDLIVGDRFAFYRLLLNDGRGGFSDASSRLPPVVGLLTGIEVADVDADADLDILLPGENGGRFAVWINHGTARFTDESALWVPPLRFVLALAAGDMEHDGDADVAVVDDAGRPSLLVASAGRFLAGNDERIERPNPSFSHVLADLDGDGDLDLIGPEPTLALNDGTGRLVLAAPGRVPATSGPGASTSLADVDGDGDPDVLIGGHLRLHLFLNDGRASFTETTATHLPAPRFTFGTPALSDVDGDGDLDLVLAIAGQNRLYVNDGSGRFADETLARLPTDNDETTFVVAGDVDDDGDADLLFANVAGAGQQSRLYLNDGSGRFADVSTTHLPAAPLKTMTLALGDVDGDRDLDLVLGNLYGPYSVLWTNDGSGRFQTSSLPPAVGPIVASRLADVDGDGDLDLVLSQSRSATARPQLLCNDGRGTFVDVSSRLEPAYGFVTAGDLDRDGDTDLVFDSGVRCNRQRHVSTPYLAATGTPLVIDFAAEPGYATEDHLALPVLATAILSVPLPVAWGLLFVHPGFAVTLPAVVIPAPIGEARLSLPIPDDPILVGVHGHVQALVVTASAPLRDPHLTGFTTDTVIR